MDLTKKTKKKQLKAYDLNGETFDKILTDYADCIKKLDNGKTFADYTSGYPQKHTIIYDGIKKLIILECNLEEYLIAEDKVYFENTINSLTHWKQCICYRRESQKERITKSTTGGTAWRIVKQNILNSGYSEEQFECQLNKFKAQYNSELTQLHYNYEQHDGDKIYKYENCVKYDINGAYAAALIEIFPKAEPYIKLLYTQRKLKPIYKQYINYFVGMLAVNGHRLTFNYIVQKVRKQMDETVDLCDGILLYANTDGFAIQNAKRKPKAVGKELGEFKVEYEGDIYTYAGTNYWIMQTGDKITGNCLWSARKFVDLRIGKAVKYTSKSLGFATIATDVQVIRREISIQ